MGFGLRRTVRKVKQKMGPFGFMLDPLNLSKKSNSGQPGPDFGFQDPNAIANEERARLEGFGFSNMPDRRKAIEGFEFAKSPDQRGALDSFQFGDTGLRGSLGSDVAFGGNVDFGGPGIEDDSAAYDEFLRSSEASRAREESRGVENVLGNLQGRGLARSGIALKDIVNQVIGPSSERAGQMAAQFGLERARRRSDLLEGQRQAQRQASLNQIQNRAGALGDEFAGIRRQGELRFGGLRDILGDETETMRQRDAMRFGGLKDILSDESDTMRERDRLKFGGIAGIGSARLGGALDERMLNLENQIANRKGMEERRRKRKSALMGLLGGGVGGYFGGPSGAMVGNQVGQQAADTF